MRFLCSLINFIGFVHNYIFERSMLVGMIMVIRVKARYEEKVLKPLREIKLREGEEVEIEVRRPPVDEFHGRMKIDAQTADVIVDMELLD
jgi:predicted DNA-binding antitoxin AbrB/MazE fold protein